jgi:putative ABC transport system ATP-binding protein
MEFLGKDRFRRRSGATDAPHRTWMDRLAGSGSSRPKGIRGRLLRLVTSPTRLPFALVAGVKAARGRLRREAEVEEPTPEPIVPGVPTRGYVPPKPPAVAGRNLIKRFGTGPAAVEALRGVTVAFEQASFNAIMGPSGSGKSTLMHLLAGLDAPSGGGVEIAGVDLAELGDGELTELRRRQVGFVFQAFNLMSTLDAEENIALPLRLAGETPDAAWMEALLRAVDLSDRRDHRPAELSGGQQQKVAIARALVAKPNVIFADEPTGNLDSVSSDEVMMLLRRAVDEFGQTVVMVTHDPLVAAHADRIVSLADGRIVDDKANSERPPPTRPGPRWR